MAKLILKDKFVDMMKEGYPCIFSGLFIDKNRIGQLDEGEVVKLYSAKKEFVAKGYIGLENKNSGWILSTSDEEINQMFFSKKIAKAVNFRQKFFVDSKTNAFRLINGIGDDIGGLIVDYYDGYILIQWYNKGLYKFKEYIYNAINNIVFPKGIYEKRRFGKNGSFIEGDSFVSGERNDDNFTILENGVKYVVNMNDGAMTGIFLDQREVRNSLIREYAKGRKVLNTFSYTGAFSVASAVGGASETYSVDLANRSYELTKANFEANEISLSNNNIVVDDVFNYHKKFEFNKNFGEFDMVILDPPSFSRSKDHVFTVEKDYRDLVKDFSALLRHQGILVASTNYAKISQEEFLNKVTTGLRDNGFKFKVLEEYGQPQDFKYYEKYEESKYLKVLIIRIYRK